MYNALVNEVTDVRCRSKDKCEGCIFVSRDGDKDGEKNKNSPSRQEDRQDHKDL